LRDRPEDIPALARFFLGKYAAEFKTPKPAIHADALSFLQAQAWPGNVRELENVIRKVLLQARGYTISADFVKAALAKTGHLPVTAERSLDAYAEELLGAAQRGEISDAHAQLHETAERILIGRAIEKAHGNQAQAARWLGISRLTLREKLIHFGLHPGRETE
jgi:DNA-binding NtrC family response regulator